MKIHPLYATTTINTVTNLPEIVSKLTVFDTYHAALDNRERNHSLSRPVGLRFHGEKTLEGLAQIDIYQEPPRSPVTMMWGMLLEKKGLGRISVVASGDLQTDLTPLEQLEDKLVDVVNTLTDMLELHTKKGNLATKLGLYHGSKLKLCEEALRMRETFGFSYDQNFLFGLYGLQMSTAAAEAMYELASDEPQQSPLVTPESSRRDIIRQRLRALLPMFKLQQIEMLLTLLKGGPNENYRQIIVGKEIGRGLGFHLERSTDFAVKK